MKEKVNEIMQFLLGDTKIETSGGYYTLSIQDEGEEINVTVDFHNSEISTGSLQHSVLFNETYPENEFTFEQLSEDLNAQDLEIVDQWVVNFAESKGLEMGN